MLITIFPRVTAGDLQLSYAVYHWTCAKAYSGWIDNNADEKSCYDQPDHIAGHASFELDIPVKSYVPIGPFYGQAQYGGGVLLQHHEPRY